MDWEGLHPQEELNSTHHKNFLLGRFTVNIARQEHLLHVELVHSQLNTKNHETSKKLHKTPENDKKGTVHPI